MSLIHDHWFTLCLASRLTRFLSPSGLTAKLALVPEKSLNLLLLLRLNRYLAVTPVSKFSFKLESSRESGWYLNCYEVEKVWRSEAEEEFCFFARSLDVQTTLLRETRFRFILGFGFSPAVSWRSTGERLSTDFMGPLSSSLSLEKVGWWCQMWPVLSSFFVSFFVLLSQVKSSELTYLQIVFIESHVTFSINYFKMK